MTIHTLTFFSNYFNHHQKALCDEFYKLLGDGFTFVATMPMEEFRANMGWGEAEPSYVLKSYTSDENEKKAQELSLSSDLVIFGTAPEYYIKPRLSQNRIIFRYSERPLKEGFIKFFIPRLTKKYIDMHLSNRNKNIHILGASAFTSLDYKKMFNSYPGKCYKFGYFPEHISYDVDKLIEKKAELSKQSGAVNILWEGRLLKLKRADLLITALRMLKNKGYDFRCTIVGEGPEKEKLIKMTEDYGLNDVINFEDFLSPKEARAKMADAQIYVMTSNFWEGWGSVIYESLNAGCAVVASHAAGATPFLVKDGKTGLVFKSGSAKSLSDKIEMLLKDEALTQKLQRNAYNQMHTLWNPTVAAKRTIMLAECIEDNKANPFEDGPLSAAEYIPNNWI